MSTHDKHDPIHEHTNEVQEAWDNAKAFWNKYGTHVLLVILIVLGAFVFTRWYSGREMRLKEEAYAALADTSTPRGKQEVAAEFDHVPGFAGFAKLEAADLTLREALNLSLDATGMPTPAPSPEEMKSKLNDAAALYQEVIDLDGSPLQVINAEFGLAAVHESLGNFDKAGEAYDAAAAKAGDSWPHLAETAKRLKGELPRISTPVTFAKPKSLVPGETPSPGAVVPDAPGAPDLSGGLTDPGKTEPDATTPDKPETPAVPETPVAPESSDKPTE